MHRTPIGTSSGDRSLVRDSGPAVPTGEHPTKADSDGQCEQQKYERAHGSVSIREFRRIGNAHGFQDNGCQMMQAGRELDDLEAIGDQIPSLIQQLIE